MRELVARAVRVKAEVVAEDETECGRRAILNFGHTVGHALESASNYGLLHGEAVALGMVAALELGGHAGRGPPALAQRAVALLARLALPVDLARRLDADVMARVTVDKKRRGSTIRFVLCPKPGETMLRDLTPTEIAAQGWAPPKLDPRIPSEYKPKATMASPFRESIEKLLNGIEGAVSCVLMGFDGITVDIYREGAAATRCPTSRRCRWSSRTSSRRRGAPCSRSTRARSQRSRCAPTR